MTTLVLHLNPALSAVEGQGISNIPEKDIKVAANMTFSFACDKPALLDNIFVP